MPCCCAQKEEKTCCPVESLLKLIGGKYKTLILWNLFGKKALRFSELQKLVPEASPRMLTRQLRELEADGLITRTVYPVVPPKVEYALSALGESLRPVLSSMYDWGSAYLLSRGLSPNCTMERLSPIENFSLNK